MALSFLEFRESTVSKTPHFLVIGHPVSHSLSPVMHNTAIQFHKLQASYVAVDVSENELNSFISWCNRDEFLGCNITIPYKEMLLNMVDEVDSVARRIGAVNTIFKDGNRLIGSNTDAYGFIKPLQPYLGNSENKNAIVFGTGGSSKAVKTALEDEGFEQIIFVSRNAGNRNISSDHSEILIVDYSQWQDYATETGLFVNSTPLGMYPGFEQSPVSESEANLLAGSICYDLIYNPLQSTFLALAEGKQAVTINGLEMLIQQGSKSFELWTGFTFPIELVKEQLDNHFNR